MALGMEMITFDSLDPDRLAAWWAGATNSEVTAVMPGGRTEQFQGKITFVSPEVEPVTKDFRIVAEVVNRDGLLRPGLDATLTIHPATVTAARLPADVGPTLER